MSNVISATKMFLPKDIPPSARNRQMKANRKLTSVMKRTSRWIILACPKLKTWHRAWVKRMHFFYSSSLVFLSQSSMVVVLLAPQTYRNTWGHQSPKFRSILIVYKHCKLIFGWPNLPTVSLHRGQCALVYERRAKSTNLSFSQCDSSAEEDVAHFYIPPC